MKKVILGLLILSVFSLQSQVQCLDKPARASRYQTTCFEESTNLNDSIRVVGADGIHKNMKRSVFLSGIGSQNLQQTLGFGDTASRPLFIENAFFRTEVNGGLITIKNTNNNNGSQINVSGFSNDNFDEYSYLSSHNGLTLANKNDVNQDYFQLINNEALFRLILKTPVISSNQTRYLPISVAGVFSDSNGNIPLSFGSGTVIDFNFTNANGITGAVTNSTTNPTLVLSLGAITPTTVVASGDITAPNVLSTNATDIAGKQPQINGTGFVKASGTTISYDNSTYLTSSSLVPITGGAFTNTFNLTSTVGTYYTDLTQTGAITLVIGGGAVVGAVDYLKLTANGNTITIPAGAINLGSDTISTTSGAVNRIFFTKTPTEILYTVKVN